jgi:carbonic anhydrase
MASGQLFIHGWVYSIETSEIKAYDAEQDRFIPLDRNHPIPCATPKGRF